MNPLKKLASQTAIYGLSSIVGRFLNYLLVPLHTAQFIALQYGIITEMYAYVAFLVVLLTYGMETAFFKFTATKEHNSSEVFRTAVTSLLLTTTTFIVAITIFSVPIPEWLKYPHHTEYVIWFAIIVGLDAVSSIPLARLRFENRPKVFASVNLANIAVNIGLNIFFIGYCMPAHKAGISNFLIDNFYNPNIGVGYVFISNLVASIFKFLVLIPFILKDRLGLSFSLLKKMLIYSIPLLFAGLAGIINETLDRIMLKRMLWDTLGEAGTLTQLGIYGACYKISIIITLFIQSFRYAAEPFFFSQSKEENAHEIYSKVMNYFIIVCSFIFLGVMLYLDIIKHFLQNEVYWEGLKIVPVLLLANIFLGIYLNLSIWYKLSGKTMYGAYFSFFGAAITIILNLLLIPIFGYVGSAWATLLCYFAQCVVSYFFGQSNYYINYDLKRFVFYIGMAILFWMSFDLLHIKGFFISHLIRLLFLTGFLIIVFLLERKNIHLTIKK